MAGGRQHSERGRIFGIAPALPDGRLVGVQVEGGERGEDLLRGAGHRARAVDVLDAHQPVARVGTCVEPARERADQ